jgi:hypothetical protein
VHMHILQLPSMDTNQRIMWITDIALRCTRRRMLPLYIQFLVTPGRPRKGRTRAPDESRDPKNPHRMRKFGLRGKCGYCKMLGHNSRTCPSKKQPATEVELPTPPPASVSLIPNCILLLLMLTWVGLLTFGIFSSSSWWGSDPE